jgi:broad specificity phosphatase PhoE
MSTKLLIIRHGQIGANRAGRWHGATDSPLTPLGRRQARRVAQVLARELGGVDAVYSSPLKRCYHTARCIGDLLGRTVVANDDLREYTIGELEDTPYRVLHQQHRFFERIVADPDFAPPGGESMNRVADRAAGALERIVAAHADAAHVAVISHGAAMAIALARLLDGDLTRWTNYHLANCSITELVLDPAPLMSAFNRIEHLS